MSILITGAAGFIGFHLAKHLLEMGETVIGIDNLNNYYDVDLKKARLAELAIFQNFHFNYIDLIDRVGIESLFNQSFQSVVHLAAQAGVRYSLENPYSYLDSNLSGFLNILEGCRNQRIPHLVFASSSSVYGSNTKIPFAIKDNVDYPISLYAATKKANELMAHAYSHLYEIPMTGLRFFTVYGPWGRPDMAYFKFVRAIEQNQPINVYNYGNMKRDFTYIDDVVEGIFRVLKHPPNSNLQCTSAPYKLYNIGNQNPVSLLTFIEVIESALGKTAEKVFLPMQPGDVPTTYADVTELIEDVGFKPVTQIKEGIDKFVEWYQYYYFGNSPGTF